MDIQLTADTVEGKVTRGKRRHQGTRPGFDWSLVRYCPADFDLFGRLGQLWADAAGRGGKVFLIPDLAEAAAWDTAVWRSAHMPYTKFVALLRRLLDDPGVTYNSARRFLPSIGGALNLVESDAQAISNWQ